MTAKKIGEHKRIIITLLIALSIALVAVLVWPKARPHSAPGMAITADAKKFKEQYARLADDNRFVYATADQVLELFDRGSGVVFLGFKECPWCQQLAPIVDEAAKAERLDKIYYLDIRQARADNDATYQKLLEKLSPYVNKDKEGNPRIYVPDVTALRDGKIVGHFKQETTADGEEATPDSYWTDERRARAIDQLRQMMVDTRAFAAVRQALSQGASLIDVRTRAEYQQGHIAGARILPLADIQNGAAPNVDKNTTIYLYCRSGNRSAEAAEHLKKAGFSDVRDLGGIASVIGSGGTIITPAQQ